MEYLTTNFRSISRRTIYDGESHIVVPCTMIVPGVLNGSQGALFYPPEEVRRSVDAWNGVPVTIYHPEQGGQSVSARSPGVMEKQQVGLVFSARMKKNELKASLYLNERKLKQKAPDVLEAAENGHKVEVSTGLGTDKSPAPNGSTFNGKEYTHVARNYKPDHLAILPDQIGACSLEDGCGMNVNMASSEEAWKRFVKNRIPGEKTLTMSDVINHFVRQGE